jgi:hypothetical protein
VRRPFGQLVARLGEMPVEEDRFRGHLGTIF